MRMRTPSESLRVLCGLKTYKPSSIPDLLLQQPQVWEFEGCAPNPRLVQGFCTPGSSMEKAPSEGRYPEQAPKWVLRDPEALEATGEGSREVEVL